MDAHENALNVAREIIKNDTFMEITYKTPFGFTEMVNRVNISVDTFIRPSFISPHKICLLHILLGCGIGLRKVIDVVNKALKLCDRVIVMDHNRESLDWEWNLRSEVEDHFLYSCISSKEFRSIAHLYGWEIIREVLIPGNKAMDRNFAFELLGKIPSVDYSDQFNVLKKLKIPVFNNFKPPNFSNIYDVYLGSADSSENFVSNSRISIPNRNYTLYASCGGFFSLNYIHLLRDTQIKNIVMFDINPYSVEFCSTVFKMIKNYTSRDEFLSNYLLCTVKDNRVIPTTWESRLGYYMKNFKLYNETSKIIFQLIFNGTPFEEGILVYGMRNCADNRTDKPGKLYLSYDSDKFVAENSLHVNHKGWMETDETYKETREVLLKANTIYSSENIMNLKPDDNDVILASNIFTFLSAESRDKFRCTIIEG